MELYEWAQKLGVKQVRISESEWDKYYSNTYNTLRLEGELTKDDLISAAEDIVFVYKLREEGMIERKVEQKARHS